MLQSGEQIRADKEDDMDIENILQQLRHQAGRLDAAISALEGGAARRGRPRKAQSAVAGQRSGPRHMSAAARAKIAAAQRARWAKQKGKTISAKSSAAKKRAPVAKKAARKGMSAASRKRLSDLMKQRWAARKKA